MDATTGPLKWHFQFTPHDVWDYAAEEPMTYQFDHQQYVAIVAGSNIIAFGLRQAGRKRFLYRRGAQRDELLVIELP